MSLEAFHPITAEWFAETLGEPTIAQCRGWAAIREGRHTLIAAPTGSGKTLAAFLIALDDLLKDALAAPARRRRPRRLRLAAEGAERRHPQESRGAAPRPAARRRGARLERAGDYGRGSDRRHAAARARVDAADAAAHSGHDARVAVSPAHRRTQPRDAAHRPDGDRRRNPRGDRRPPRRPSRAVARAAAGGRRAAAPANRPVGDAEADR